MHIGWRNFGEPSKLEGSDGKEKRKQRSLLYAAFLHISRFPKPLKFTSTGKKELNQHLLGFFTSTKTQVVDNQKQPLLNPWLWLAARISKTEIPRPMAFGGRSCGHQKLRKTEDVLS
jgi:hypothetical protein